LPGPSSVSNGGHGCIVDALVLRNCTPKEQATATERAMTAEDQEKREQEKREAEARQWKEDLEAIPFQPIDRSTWPKTVRPVSLDEEGLGIDRDGRLYWNGKPVEIVGQRLDLTRTQAWVAIAVAVFTFIAAAGTAVQGWTAYHDWACKTGWRPFVACPLNVVSESPLPTESGQPNPRPQPNGDRYR
jgi:hypothetical protein